MATYAHTYTVKDFSYVEFEGEKVVVQIIFTVATTRSDPSGSVSFDQTINFSRDCKNWVIPRAMNGDLASMTPQARTDFKSFDSLTIPNDLVTWIQNIYNNDAQRMEVLNAIAESKIGG
jgi:hypothetical protein